MGGLPHKLAFWLLSLTESATWWPQAAVQGLVPRPGPDRPREAVPAPAACPVLCYSRLYLHLGYVGGASHLSSPASCSPQEETGARLLLAWI